MLRILSPSRKPVHARFALLNLHTTSTPF
jgi:hypothetical protein